jgi:SAM-dependent methyltransferase
VDKPGFCQKPGLLTGKKLMMIENQLQMLYNDLSSWWHLFSPPEDYEEEAAFYKKIFLDYSSQTPKTILELGSGGGNNASFFKHDFEMTLVDLSPGMLEISRKINPECEHIQGDMRTVQLNRVFDGVFIHDAIMYITTKDDLRKVMETAFVHCRPGGIALFAPDWVKETFNPSTDHGGTDGDGRGIRYLEWTHDPDPNDTTYFVEFAFLLHEPGKNTQVKYDRHVFGLFKRDVWLQLLRDVGFESRTIKDPYERELFLGIIPFIE